MKKENIKRLNAYKANLILFPVQEDKPKTGEIHDTTEKTDDLKQNTVSGVISLPKRKVRVGIAALTKELKSAKVYRKIRQSRVDRKYEGKRVKLSKAAEDAKKRAIFSVKPHHKCNYSSWLRAIKHVYITFQVQILVMAYLEFEHDNDISSTVDLF